MKTKRIIHTIITVVLVITITCFAQRNGGEKRDKPTPDQVVERMTEKLLLTEDQQESIKALYTDFFAEMEAMRESRDRSTMRESMSNLKYELDEDIKTLDTEISEIGWFTYKEARKLEMAFSYNKAIDDLYNKKLIE